MIMARFLAFLLAALLLASLLSEVADAATTRISCVKNNIDLIFAINNAKGDAEGSIEDIRLTQGSYSIAGIDLDTAGYPDDKTIKITGGWLSNCTEQTLNPDNTSINLENGDVYFIGDNKRITIEGLTFINYAQFLALRANCAAGGICPNSDEDIRIDHNIFYFGSEKIELGSYRNKSISFENNLLINAGYLAVLCYHDGCTIAHNTVVASNCEDTAAVFLSRDSGSAIFHHNIVSTTACTSDVRASGNWVFAKNLYETWSGTATAPWKQTADPGFKDPANGDFHLRETDTPTPSPAINAGMTEGEANVQSIFFPIQDLDGPTGERVIGNRIDLGAYESSVDTSPVQWVTSNLDSGLGTLRQAIINANASPDPVRILFDFSGGVIDPNVCAKGTILLKTPLPPITNSLSIEGYSADQATHNTAEVGFNAAICVWVKNDPTNAVPVTQALVVPAGAANADVALSVSGLQFSGFAGSVISLDGGAGHSIQGNVFGGTGGAQSNGRGVLVGSGVNDVLIGGSDKAQRNWIGQSTDAAVLLRGSNATVMGNLIGPDADGLGKV
jgi:hypothetical protein